MIELVILLACFLVLLATAYPLERWDHRRRTGSWGWLCEWSCDCAPLLAIERDRESDDLVLRRRQAVRERTNTDTRRALKPW